MRHRYHLSNGDGVFATIEKNGVYADTLLGVKSPKIEDVPRSLIDDENLVPSQRSTWLCFKDYG
jgi:hypothetical protein